LNYLLVASFALIIPAFFVVNSILDESERYILLLDDDFSNDVYLEFYEIESEKNRQMIIDQGFVKLGDEEFEIIENWKGSFLDQDKLFFMAGKAYGFDRDIDVFVMGEFLEKTIDGSLYDITIHIHSDNPTEFKTKGEVMGLNPKETPKDMPQEISTETSLDLLFLIKDSHHRFQDQEYVFTTKLYDKKQNPLGQWNVKGGEIIGAEIVVKAVNLEGNVLREIHGNTNEFGWFDGKFPIGTTFPRGEYLVIYTVKYENNIIEEQKPLYVFEVQSHSSTRHFLPTSDILTGHWNDNKGNQNGLIFDDLDEYDPTVGPYSSIDNTDYVHSKSLGKKDSFDNDTFLVGITTNGGVTSDHDHIIAYTMGKDQIDGSDINFTVTLLEGSREIAQWTHLNVTTGFNLITNTLTLEQAKSISDYGNLNLNFTAWCDPCKGGSDKRDGQVSWIHMIV